MNARRAFGRSGCLRAAIRRRNGTSTPRQRSVEGRRAAQREAAQLVELASQGRLSTERDTLGGLLDRWLDHIEARGRAPKTLLENRRLATVISAELGGKELRKVTGRHLDAFYDRLRRRGLSSTSVGCYHAVLSAALNQEVR